MAISIMRPFIDCKLDVANDVDGSPSFNHIIEPEFHQEKYVNAGTEAKATKNAFQLGDLSLLARPIGRGRQPSYADDETDSLSLNYEGMMQNSGVRLDSGGANRNVSALKSASIRRGYIDFELSRSVTREFFHANKLRAGVVENDLLINSTGDGTIGRVAVYNQKFPALVDGHITIIRFQDPVLSWYSAAYLLSEAGQDQIYRYINGSSGQVEIYHQDISRIWIKGSERTDMERIAGLLKSACKKHDEFFVDMTKALAPF